MLGARVQFALVAGGFRLGDVGSQGMKRVVGDQAAPNERPEGVEGFAGVASADGLVKLGEEAGSCLAQRG